MNFRYLSSIASNNFDVNLRYWSLLVLNFYWERILILFSVLLFFSLTYCISMIFLGILECFEYCTTVTWFLINFHAKIRFSGCYMFWSIAFCSKYIDIFSWCTNIMIIQTYFNLEKYVDVLCKLVIWLVLCGTCPIYQL